MQQNNLYSYYIIFIFTYKKFIAAVKFQYHNDNAILQTAKGCRQDVFPSSTQHKLKRKGITFPWPHENNISTLLVNNPKKPQFLFVNLLSMATRLELKIKSLEEMLANVSLSISHDPITTFQCFPYLSRAIIPVIVQNANIPMIISVSFS